MNTALILHSIREAEYCVKQRLHDGCLLLSTNPCVDVFLKERYAIECQCVSRLLTQDELALQKKKASDAADRVLASLDEKIAPFLNAQLGLKMKYFTPIYSYLGKHYLLGMIAFIEALRKIITIHRLDRIMIFDSRYQDFLDVDPGMAPLIARFFPQIVCETIRHPGIRTGGIDRFVRLKRLMQKVLNPRAWPALFHKAAKALREYSRRRHAAGTKSVLLCEPLLFLDFLNDSLPEYNLIHCTIEGYPTGFMRGILRPKVQLDRPKLDSLLKGKREEPFEDLFLQGIREDFTKGIAHYAQPVLSLKEIHEKNPISLAVWGNIGGFPKYLLFEYLKSEGVEIVGAQHGNSYVDQIASWVLESDFDRCDHFISWGFTKDDLSRAYPDAKACFEVHPLGFVRPEPVQSDRLDIDIVFPMTWGMTVFDGGPARLKPDLLIERQIKLLEYLNSLEGLSVYIKPPPRPTLDNCAALAPLRRLRNLHFIDNMSYGEFLKKYNPRAVVSEYPASVLYQSLHLDAEIFLIPDSLDPYEAQALAELKKRVHTCEDADAAIAKLDLFLAGRLEKKRDNTYYHHYFHKPNARENTLSLIHDLADRRPRAEPSRTV